jgi:hypothetical protein
VAVLQLLHGRRAHRKGAGDEVIEQHAETVEIGSFAGGCPGENLRRQIERRSGEVW